MDDERVFMCQIELCPCPGIEKYLEDLDYHCRFITDKICNKSAIIL
jgi:hypothetical protein